MALVIGNKGEGSVQGNRGAHQGKAQSQAVLPVFRINGEGNIHAKAGKTVGFHLAGGGGKDFHALILLGDQEPGAGVAGFVGKPGGFQRSDIGVIRSGYGFKGFIQLCGGIRLGYFGKEGSDGGIGNDLFRSGQQGGSGLLGGDAVRRSGSVFHTGYGKGAGFRLPGCGQEGVGQLGECIVHRLGDGFHIQVFQGIRVQGDAAGGGGSLGGDVLGGGAAELIQLGLGDGKHGGGEEGGSHVPAVPGRIGSHGDGGGGLALHIHRQAAEGGGAHVVEGQGVDQINDSGKGIGNLGKLPLVISENGQKGGKFPFHGNSRIHGNGLFNTGAGQIAAQAGEGQNEGQQSRYQIRHLITPFRAR